VEITGVQAPNRNTGMLAIMPISAGRPTFFQMVRIQMFIDVISLA
jgi:hypothetical protein